MASRGISFEWTTVEDDGRWKRFLVDDDWMTVESPLIRDGDRWLTLQLLRGFALCFVALILLDSVARSPEERTRIRAENGIRNVLAIEEEARRTDNQDLFSQLIDRQNTGQWQRIWHDSLVAEQSTTIEQSPTDAPVVTLLKIEPAGRLVMTEVLVNQPSSGWTQFRPYRETRFYRKTERGWLRTVPGNRYWGAHQIVETPLLRFEFRSRDSETVQAVAEQLDLLYADLYDTLGLKLDTMSEKLTFVITPEPVSGRGGYTKRYEITSPLLSQKPETISATDYLVQTAVSRMTYLAVNRSVSVGDNANRMGGSSYRWRNMQRGLRSWLRMELLEPDWSWDQISTELFSKRLSDHLPLTLRDVSEDDVDRLIDRDYQYWQTAAAASVIAYAVETYGEEVLPVLVHSFQSDRRWQELIPKIFDTSVEEFEAGWNQFLAQGLQ